VAGATRPVGGGAYSGPRSEPGGRNTPRAGRSVAAYGSYTPVVGTFTQQVDQGDIFDEGADGLVIADGSGVEDYSVDESATATVTASGTGVESYVYTEAGSGTVTASGTGVESFRPPVTYTDSGSGTVTASGTGVEGYFLATPYDLVIDVDSPVSHWKLGNTSTAVDRKGVRNLPAQNGPIASAATLVANNGTDSANTFVRASGHFFGTPPATGIGAPYESSVWSVEAWFSAASLPGSGVVMGIAGRDSSQVFRITEPGALSLRWRDATDTPDVTGAFNVVVGTTYHVVGVFDGTNAILYVNGVEHSRRATTSLSLPNAVPSIGSQLYGTPQAFAGTVDEVAWYTTVLSPARVLAHYQAGSGTVFNDTGSGTVTASGTRTESATYADSGSGSVTASGTSVESAAYGDSATITTSGLYDSTVDVDTPVSHWKLGETGQATDRKGVQNLQAVSSPPTAESLVANNGSDAANSFDGARSPAVAQRFSVPQAAGVGTPYNTSTWSAEVWIKASSLAGSPDVLRRGSAAYLWISSLGDVIWSFGGGGVSNGVVSAGRTAHLVMTFDGATGRGYIDGKLAHTQAGSPVSTDTAAPIIGSRVESGAVNGAFQGTIDEVSWYNTALSLARVQAHYRAGLRYEIGSSGTSAESYAYTDTGSGTVTASGSGVEDFQLGGVTYNDTGSGTVTASGSGTESSASSDSSTGTATASGTGVESAAYTDSASGTTTASGSGTEGYAYNDSRSGTVTASGTGSDSYALSESASGTVTASGSGVESYVYTDTRSGTVTASGSGVESLVSAYTDSGSGTITASGTRTESYAVSESASAVVTASGTGVEAFAHSGSASGTATASGTGTESDAHSASASGTVTASGTRVESAVFTDAASSTATASGTGVEKASRIKDAAVSLLGVGVVVVAARRARVGATSLLGTGTLAVSARRRRASSTALVGVGTLGVQARRNLRSSVALTGVASLHVVPAITGVEFGAVSLVGQGTLSASARRRRSASSTLTGVASLDADARRSRRAASVLVGAGTLAADARRSRRAATDLTGVGTLRVVPAITGVEFGAVSLVGSATLSASAKRQRASAVALVGVGTLDVDGVVVAVPQDVGAVRLIGTSSLSARARRRRSARVSLVGEGILTATPFVQKGRPWIVTGSTERLDATGVAGSVGRVWVVTGPVQRPGVRAAAGVVGRAGPNGQGSVDRPATIETGSIEWATTSP
jgi:hypothetical protein